MIADVLELGEKLTGGSVDTLLDRAFPLIEDFGFSGLAYDFTPVAFSPQGEIITPSLIRVRNLPDDMLAHWCDEGFYQIDPVQRIALSSSCPFVWSYRPEARTPINPVLSDVHTPVIEYLNDTRIYSGITVPIHMQDGACAVVTGFWYAAKPGFVRRAGGAMADFSLLANLLHAKLLPTLGEEAHLTRAVHLTARERECIRLAAEGYSAKQIALRIGRSLPTVVMHLQSAARKLGARNRAQAIARAAHYRLLS